MWKRIDEDDIRGVHVREETYQKFLQSGTPIIPKTEAPLIPPRERRHEKEAALHHPPDAHSVPDICQNVRRLGKRLRHVPWGSNRCMSSGREVGMAFG